MNVLVIEYEKGMVQKIKDLLYQIDDSIHVVGVTDDMFTAAEWLTKNKIPDLILANESVMASVETESKRKIRAIVTFPLLQKSTILRLSDIKPSGRY